SRGASGVDPRVDRSLARVLEPVDRQAQGVEHAASDGLRARAKQTAGSFLLRNLLAPRKAIHAQLCQLERLLGGKPQLGTSPQETDFEMLPLVHELSLPQLGEGVNSVHRAGCRTQGP